MTKFDFAIAEETFQSWATTAMAIPPLIRVHLAMRDNGRIGFWIDSHVRALVQDPYGGCHTRFSFPAAGQVVVVVEDSQFQANAGRATCDVDSIIVEPFIREVGRYFGSGEAGSFRLLHDSVLGRIYPSLYSMVLERYPDLDIDTKVFNGRPQLQVLGPQRKVLLEMSESEQDWRLETVDFKYFSWAEGHEYPQIRTTPFITGAVGRLYSDLVNFQKYVESRK